MKAAPFAYVRPATVQDALVELDRDGAKVLAGGQSLVPVLAMRLGRPSVLVDINAIPELAELSGTKQQLRVGATVRQRQLQYDELAVRVPLLRLALPWVGHREIRSRGTVCGSIAHADPAAELPAVASCLGATMVLHSNRGRREVAAADFFAGAMTTAAATDELLTEVRFPTVAPGEGFGFAEFARRHGDFALAGVAVKVCTHQHGQPLAWLTCFGVSDRPVTTDTSALLQQALTQCAAHLAEPELTSALRAPAAEMAEQIVDTGGDAHASTDYRRRLIAALAARELSRAYFKSLRPTPEKPPT